MRQQGFQDMWFQLSVLIVGVAGIPSQHDYEDAANSHHSIRAADQLPSAPFDWGADVSGPLCGIYAACTAAELVGLRADPREFLASRYSGTCGGSTPEEVASAVRDAGANAHVLTHLSAVDVQLLKCPIIANVRAVPTSDRFNHWVVVVPGTSGLEVYDGVEQPIEVRTAEFLGIWNGIGICVSKDKTNPLVTIWLARIALLLSIGIACILVFRKRSVTAPLHKPRAFKQILAVCLATAALCVLGNSIFGDLPNHGRGVAVATASADTGRYRVGTLDDAEMASASPNFLLIDARREEDFRLGSIQGAVNIPVNASIWAISKYLAKLDRDTPIVVFCQSAQCEFNKTVADQVSSLGFNNVKVCDEGWSEFVKKHRK